MATLGSSEQLFTLCASLLNKDHIILIHISMSKHMLRYVLLRPLCFENLMPLCLYGLKGPCRYVLLKPFLLVFLCVYHSFFEKSIFYL